jgi:hypothetical protein
VSLAPSTEQVSGVGVCAGVVCGVVWCAGRVVLWGAGYTVE